jgi:hypothetical protein
MNVICERVIGTLRRELLDLAGDGAAPGRASPAKAQPTARNRVSERDTMMEKVDFTGMEQTMLTTLYLRAWESRSKDSILRDHVAAELVDRLDYDFSKLILRGGAGNRFMLALRAKQLRILRPLRATQQHHPA